MRLSAPLSFPLSLPVRQQIDPPAGYRHTCQFFRHWEPGADQRTGIGAQAFDLHVAKGQPVFGAAWRPMDFGTEGNDVVIGIRAMFDFHAVELDHAAGKGVNGTAISFGGTENSCVLDDRPFRAGLDDMPVLDGISEQAAPDEEFGVRAGDLNLMRLPACPLGARICCPQ
jgi:hypothetical protein